jgi:predicted alpha/beta-fold hydrolase
MLQMRKPRSRCQGLAHSATRNLPGAVLRGKLLSTGYARQLLTTGDGGTIALDWWRGCNAPDALPADAPVLLVLHGLTGAYRGQLHLSCLQAVRGSHVNAPSSHFNL